MWRALGWIWIALLFVSGCEPTRQAADAAELAGALRHGLVTLSSGVLPSGAGASTQQGHASARFVEGPRSTGFPRWCLREAIEACELVRCPIPDGGLPADLGVPTGLAKNGGEVGVRGARIPILLIPDEHGLYSELFQTTLLWTGGETLTVEGAGGETPPFVGSLATPGQVTITAPEAPNGQLEVLKGTRLVLRWSGGGAGELELILRPPGGSDGARAVVCRFPAAAGTGEVPWQIMSDFSTGFGSVSLGVASEQGFLVEGWAIILRAETLALAPSAQAITSVRFR